MGQVKKENGVNTISLIFSDHLGSSSVLTDEDGNITATYDYYPYGGSRIEEEVGGNMNYQYTGKEKDDATGLNYYGARYYEASMGRFTGQDPAVFILHDEAKLKEMTNEQLDDLISNPQSLNSYAYVLNNPVKMVDENGEFAGPFGRDMASGQRAISNFLHNAANYISSQGGFINKVSGFVTNTLGDTVDHVANMFDPDQKASIRVVGLGLTALDAATLGEGKSVKAFDAVAQQSKMLEGVANSRAVNVIKAVFKDSDTIPGGTMGALRNEIMTGLKTKGIFHTDKAWNVINSIKNIFKTETLNSLVINRLQGIKSSLESLIKNIEQ